VEEGMRIIDKAIKEGRNTLSEYESKKVLAAYQIPVTREILVDDIKDLSKAVKEIGYPLALKGCSPETIHKTEKGLLGWISGMKRRPGAPLKRS